MLRDGAVQSLVGNFSDVQALKVCTSKISLDVETSERKDLSKA